jgi:uncharacterized YceG family protein
VLLGLREVDERIFGEDATPGADVRVTIPEGADNDQIANILERAGVVESATKFELRVGLEGDGDDFKPGTYTLRENETYDTIVATLSAGPPAPKTVRLTIPEGFSVRDIAQRVGRVGVKAQAYRAAVEAANPPKGFLVRGEKAPELEGFLFPATYELTEPVKPRQLVADQLAAFEDNFAKIDMTYARSQGLTKYDVLIIASMIEREAAFPGDRAKISAVIYNRLKAEMPLGIDPTIQYAVGSWEPLTAADLDVDSPYNTRKVVGLPPTPIANPGLAALRAAAKPAKQDWLYFVAIPGDEERKHFFTNSYDEFLQFQAENPPETGGEGGGESGEGGANGAGSGDDGASEAAGQP